MMQAVGRRYVRAFNARHGRTGTLWEGRYKSCLVDSDRHLLACLRYIELNPVRAAMVQWPWQHRWSSVHAHLGLRRRTHVQPRTVATSQWVPILAAEPQRNAACCWSR